MNSGPFYEGLKTYFNITHGANKFIEITYLTTEKVAIDIIKFDDWLHKQIGNYEEKEGLSMKEVISKYYGGSAASFIQNIL